MERKNHSNLGRNEMRIRFWVKANERLSIPKNIPKEKIIFWVFFDRKRGRDANLCRPGTQGMRIRNCNSFRDGNWKFVSWWGLILWSRPYTARPHAIVPTLPFFTVPSLHPFLCFLFKARLKTGSILKFVPNHFSLVINLSFDREFSI